MFDRLILTEDLVDARGALVAPRGTVLSAQTVADAVRRAPRLTRRALGDTPLARDVEVPLEEPAYRHLFEGGGIRESVRRALLDVLLPESLFEELLAMRRAASPLHSHAFVTAAVAVRMLQCAVGGARGVVDLAAAALLHDVGMRHVPPRLLRQSDRLSHEDADRVAAHPILGAYHLATALGPHPAVAAAQAHHWRCGQGYPMLVKPPSRSVEVISVASAFAALTQPRSFRASAYDARGAADILATEAASRSADGNTVKLLVHALRGGRGDPRAVRFGHERAGHGPETHRYVHVSAPARSPV